MSLKKIGAALKGIAPTIAGTLLTGNPASGAALGSIIGDMLGVDKGDPDASNQIAAKLADPVEVERIRAQLEQAELTHAQEMAKIGLERHRVDGETERAAIESDERDRGSARQRQIQTGDKTPQVLAYFTIVAFACVLSVLLFKDIPPKNENILYYLLGTLSACLTQSYNFFQGSSQSSKAKTDIMAAEMKEDR